MIEMGMEEVIRFDLLAMTGRFILIFSFFLFHAGSMVCSSLFESVYLLFREKTKHQKKGSMYITMNMLDSIIEFQILFCKLAHSYQ